MPRQRKLTAVEQLIQQEVRKSLKDSKAIQRLVASTIAEVVREELAAR